ncbi:MAG: hypothetical protein H7282_04865 [Cytophagaceae bacterium]|nr:hypothetical protein [Cytophagaceae bacterium]
MKNQILEELPIEEREQGLRDICCGHEVQDYKREFNEEEITDMSKFYVQKSTAQSRSVVQKKAVIDSLKSELKIAQKELDKMLSIISTGHEVVQGEVYMIDDQESGMMGYYDPTGKLISSRRLRPEERQLRLNQSKVS